MVVLWFLYCNYIVSYNYYVLEVPRMTVMLLVHVCVYAYTHACMCACVHVCEKSVSTPYALESHDR